MTGDLATVMSDMVNQDQLSMHLPKTSENSRASNAQQPAKFANRTGKDFYKQVSQTSGINQSYQQRVV